MDKMAARLAAMLETANGRNLIERIEVLMPRPFDLRTTATIPQVGLQMLSVKLLHHQTLSGVLLPKQEECHARQMSSAWGGVHLQVLAPHASVGEPGPLHMFQNQHVRVSADAAC